MSGRPTWNSKACVLCGGCAAVCPMGAVVILPEEVAISMSCNCCGTCVDICPMKALEGGEHHGG